MLGSAIGDGGPATSAVVRSPVALALDGAGNLYIVDVGNHRIRKVTPQGTISTVAGNGRGNAFVVDPVPNGDGGSPLNAILDPAGIAVDAAGTTLWISDRYMSGTNSGAATPANSRIRKVTLAAAGAEPAIGGGGVVNGASFQGGIVSGSWFTIRGTNLSTTTNTWDKAIVNGRLPTALDGVSVTVAGKPAYIGYVSPTQINALAPDVGAGNVSVTVTTASGTSPAITVQAQAAQPAFFLWPGNYAVATRTDYTFAVKNGTFSGVTTTPAKPGDVIVLWGTGFGPTSPPAPAGTTVPSTGTYNTAGTVTVTVGGRPATVYGAALTPGFVGLYQVAIQVPAGMTAGDYPVFATVNGLQSPATTMLTVQP